MPSSIVLKKNRTGPVKAGHPWIFSGAIEHMNLDGHDDVVEVLGAQGDRLGWGLFSARSEIRVRVVAGLDGPRFDTGELRERLRGCLDRRARVGLPGTGTDVLRLCNSEGDGLPGVVVDLLGPQVAAFQLTTAPMARRRDHVIAALQEVLVGRALFEVAAPGQIRSREGIAESFGWVGAAGPKQVDVTEGGVKFRIDMATIQKTGHYADMREHRRWIASVARGRSVFDGYSYTGGFGLHAAAAGAAAVTCVDSSETAIEAARANAALNGFEQVTCKASKVDNFLRSAFDKGERFDVVVLDPPKLAPSRKHVSKALKVYESMAVEAARVVEPGGLLALGSCSSAIGQPELARALAAAVARVGRTALVVYEGGQPADHPYPAAMSEGHYLSFVAAQL